MTDNEMAEKYTEVSVNEYKYNLVDIDDIDLLKEAIAEAYIAGIKAARQEMWHDLRKNPNDLPEDCAINQDGKRVLYDHINKVWRNDDADEYICDDPIAWCEIPTFKEQIMTDKELAEKYEEKIDYIEVNDDGKRIYDSIDIQQAYIAGLKTGRKEKWHDLRKNPKDLPNGYRAVLNQDGKTTIYDPSRDFLGLDGVEVIAWCEIPKYPMVRGKGNNDWHYIKDGVLPSTEFGRAHVTVAYINAYGNPCKMDCCFNGSNFVYWDDKKPIGWKKVDIFGKIYAWKYQEKLPEPPKENEE